MGINLYIVFISFFVLEQCSSSSDLYEKAKTIAAFKRIRDTDLYNKYNVPMSDYFYNFGAELQPPSPENMQADVLVEYQRLVKHYGTCETKTFRDCVNECSTKIPLIDRCQTPKTLCGINEKYSRVGGLCNNLFIPTLGSAHTPYSQWLKSNFSDGKDTYEILTKRFTFRDKSINSMAIIVCIHIGISKIPKLPNPRLMGNLMRNASSFKCGRLKCGKQTNNFFGIFFGQLVAHDISNRRQVNFKGNLSNPVRCCNLANTRPLRKDQLNPACVAVSFPTNDPFYASKGVYCQEYIRMQATLENNCKIKFNAENTFSHFLDLSPIYSEDEQQTLESLRANTSGLFRLDAYNLFPVDDSGAYITGDIRYSQTTMLALLHALFFRMHNVIARNLQAVNLHWTDEQLFQESRRLNIAIYQYILYYEWLPLVLDNDLMKCRKLNCGGKSNPCDSYDPTIDPSSMVEFANGVFKFFHINVAEVVYVADASFNVTKIIELKYSYAALDPLKNEFNDYIRGLMRQKQRMYKIVYPDSVRNYFMPAPYRGSLVGVDGFTLNTFRGRDNGLTPFIKFYSRCFSKKIRSWDDLEPYFEPKHFKLLREIYDDINDVELYVTIYFEKRCGNFIGKIGGCVMAEQFYRYRYGDRYFYSGSANPYPFTPEQLKEIDNMTFSKLLCLTTTLETVASQSFVTISEKNPIVRCSDLGNFNFELFRQF